MSLLKKSGASTRLITPATDADNRTRSFPDRHGNDNRTHIFSEAELGRPPEPRPANAASATISLPSAATGSPPRLVNGTVLQGRYAVEGLLGVGGMSVVYRGRDLRFKDVVRTCAIKEMYQSAPDSQTRLLTLKNFERESGLLATLSHPAIPKVYDFFQENGKIYLIMELIPGRNLEAVLEGSDFALDEVRVGSWALQICDVLEYLHGHEPEPIIFRDLKPSNIIITPQDRIVLIDFGIARIFEQDQRRGTMIGTEGYAPPEQYRGIGNPRVDIYALGATLHHLLTGIDPRSETPFTFHERPIRKINPAVSPEMEAVVARAVEYNADSRPTSTREMKTLLQTVPALHGTAGSGATLAAPTIARSEGTRLVWKFKCADEVRSSAHVGEGLLYIGSYDTYLYCLKAATGEQEWKRPTQAGISSSPSTWGELVVVGSEDGLVYGMDMRKGNLRWTFRTARAVRSSPKITDRVIYVGSDDQHVYAIDGLNGRKLWQYRTWMPVRSSCAIGPEAVYVGSSDGHVYSLDAMKGGLRWKQKTQQGVISTPAIGNGLVFVGSMDGHLYALDAEGGWPVWRFKTGHCVNASPAISGSRIIVGGVDGNLYALEAKSGKLAWKYEVGAQITSSPRVSDGSVFFGGVDGVVYKIDAANGSLIWKYTTDGPLVSSPAVADGVVYVGSLDHHVYALEA